MYAKIHLLWRKFVSLNCEFLIFVGVALEVVVEKQKIASMKRRRVMNRSPKKMIKREQNFSREERRKGKIKRRKVTILIRYFVNVLKGKIL